MSMIELRRLHRYFGDTCAVNDVTFEVRAGQVFGYIGPNGAGKTTSMRILSTLDTPSAGDALVAGYSVVNDADQVRRRLGFMPDAYGVYPNMNCWEYLDFFCRAYGLRGPARMAALDRVLRFTGLDKLAEKPVTGLSKGMRQRLCLGRTLIHDPAVLVLDEPAAGLDPRARIELREMIRQLALQGKTILVSSHILTELAEMCDVVGIIEQGRLLAVGSVQEILRTLSGQERGRVRVRLLDAVEAAAEWLRARPGFSEVRVDGEQVEFVHEGDREAQADVLRDLILANFRVVEFAVQQTSLEDVFLQVTRGAVQ